jgi:ribosomal protein L44E
MQKALGEKKGMTQYAAPQLKYLMTKPLGKAIYTTDNHINSDNEDEETSKSDESLPETLEPVEDHRDNHNQKAKDKNHDDHNQDDQGDQGDQNQDDQDDQDEQSVIKSTCEVCGRTVNKSNMARHKKSQFHLTHANIHKRLYNALVRK